MSTFVIAVAAEDKKSEIHQNFGETYFFPIKLASPMIYLPYNYSSPVIISLIHTDSLPDESGQLLSRSGRPGKVLDPLFVEFYVALSRFLDISLQNRWKVLKICYYIDDLSISDDNSNLIGHTNMYINNA
jgi:hypothetical protein